MMLLRRGSSLLLTLTVTALAQAPSTQQQPMGPQPSLRTGTQLVVVDVVVTDRNGNAVHNLKADDFALLENNTAQTFKAFEEHIAPSAAEAMKLPAMPKLPPGIFTNFAVAPENGPLNILLLDRLNTPMTDQMRVQQEVNDYLKGAAPGMRMAVFGLTDHLILLQGFTSNPELLKAAVNGKAKGSPLLQDASGSGSTGSQMSDMSAEMDDANGGGPSEMTEQIQQFESMQNSFQDQLRAKYTLDAMNLLARYLSAFPGRKNLVWFSGSFPVNIMPDQDVAEHAGQNPFMAVASSEKEFRQTTALLSRSQVAVYPIGAKELEVSATTEASTDSATTDRYMRTQRGMTNALRSEENQRFSEHSTMYMMADDTGGKANVDTNGLAKAIASDLENGANYYTIAYSPTNDKMDGTFRSIQVKLKDASYTLSYRRGYFADDAGAPAGGTGGPSLNGPGGTQSNGLALALVHGSPTPAQVIFSSRVQPLGTQTEQYPAPNNRTGKGAKGPFRRFGVDFAIDPRELHFMVTQDGNRHETLEFVTSVYNAEGEMIDSTANTIATNVIPAAYAQFLRTGVPYHQEVSVPDKGEYYLRLAVRDVEQDKVGAIELAVAGVKNLPAGPQPKPAPAPKQAPSMDQPSMGGRGHHSN